MRMTRSRMVRLGLSLALVCMALTACEADSAKKADTALLSQPGATFTVAPPAHNWTLIAYGDMRFTDPSNTKDTNPTARRALVAKIAEEKPDVLLLSGDVPLKGGVANDYTVFREETAAWRKEGLKVFPAMGNHELYGSGGVENWWKAFPELRGRRWYSVHFGEAYIITVDSNLDLKPDSVQSEWVAKQLGGLPKGTKYVFVSLHRPPMADPILGDPSHDVRPNEAALAQQLEAAAKRMTAKIIVIAGHIHNYERFERNGVVYLVSGGGGAKPYRIARTPRDLYQANSFPNYHYIKFVREAGGLRATMYRWNERGGFEARDTFVVSAPAKAAAK